MKLGLSWVLVLAAVLVACSPANSVPGQGKSPGTTPVSSPSSKYLGQNLPITAQTRVGNQMIQLEVAKTPQEQAIGLMYRKQIPADRGMLFPFSPPRLVSFWMKNVSVDLDMVFLKSGTIQDIRSNVPPCTSEPCPTYGPPLLVDQVIELRGGRATELGLKVGDRLVVEFQSSSTPQPQK